MSSVRARLRLTFANYILAVPSKMNHTGSPAYRWILENTEDLLEFPDEAFDWIFMLTGDDWQSLSRHWRHLSVEAKEGLAYIVCNGPARESRDILLQGIRDADVNVARQSAESLANQRKLYAVDFPPLDSESEQLAAMLVTNGEE